MKEIANVFQPQFPFKGIVAAMAQMGFNQMGFNPRTLFANNEPGVWYDPSDFSTMYQDAAGTTPVTAVEQPVGLMLDKSKGLVLGPELVTNGAFDTDTWWSKGPNCTIANGVGVASGAGSESGWYRTGFVTVGKYYEITFTVVSISSGGFKVGFIGGPGTVRSQPGTYTVRILASGPTFGILTAGANTTGTIDNISVRELPGNHATQTTATSRPVLSARVNLLTKTEQFDDEVWAKTNVTVTPNAAVAPDGTLTAGKLATNPIVTSANYISEQVGAADRWASTYSVYAKSAGVSEFGLYFTVHNTYANFNLTDETATVVGASGVSASITSIGDGWFRCSVTTSANTHQSVRIYASRYGEAYTGDGTSGIYIWGADLRVANNGINLPPYQRVNTATDYDTVGFPHYLRFDGVDDFLVTNTITPGTDKAQVFAGVTRVGVNAASLVGLNDLNTGNSLEVFAPSSGNTVQFGSHGPVITAYEIHIFTDNTAPSTSVWSGLFDRAGGAGSEITARRNGVVGGTNVRADNTTDNFLAYPLYIGRRGGTTLPFNGHLYSLIVRFGSNLPIATIEKTEKYINTKTRAY